MELYGIVFTKNAEKSLQDIPNNEINRILNNIIYLKLWIIGKKKMDVKKLRGNIPYYRLRCGIWRIIFEVNKTERNIIILDIKQRKNTYK
jgi:mRNA interferase RelE/StbE